MCFDVDSLGKLIKRPFFYFFSFWKFIQDNHSYRISSSILKLKFPSKWINRAPGVLQVNTSDFFRWLSPTAPHNVIGFGDIYTTMALFLSLSAPFFHLSQAPDSFFLPKMLLDFKYSGFPDWIYTRYNFDRLNFSINEDNDNIYKKIIVIIIIIMIVTIMMMMKITKLISNKN